MRKYIFFFLIASAMFTGRAQTLEISGQLRPRAEFRNGYHSLSGEDTDPAFSVSQRSRLSLSYGSEKMKAMVSLQDVRIWGDVASGNKADLNGMMVYQAWGEYIPVKNFSIKAGRQTLIYDDQRLFGGSDWNQQARSHDALLLRWKAKSAFTVHLGLAYNQSADKDTGTFYALDKNYKAMQFAYLHGGKDKEGFGYSLYFINVGMPFGELVDSVYQQNTAFSQTFSPRITYQKGKLSSSASLYYQVGKNQKNSSKSAFFAGADLIYQYCTRSTAGAGFQYLSGNHQVNPDTKDHEFSTLFGTGHKFNGWMDYFYAGSSHKGVGLLDLYLPVTYKNGKFGSEFQLHHYWSAADVKLPGSFSETMSRSLGTEAGILFTYNPADDISITAGYSQMFATTTMEAVKGGDKGKVQNWAWLMFTFNPVFFKSEK